MTDPDRRVVDLIRAAKAAQGLIRHHEQGIAAASRARRHVFELLIEEGLTQTDIARQMGITRSRVSVALKGPK